jgi:protein ImuA
MHALPAFSSTSVTKGRATALAELRLLLSQDQGRPQTSQQAKLSFDLAALDGHLPNGGLSCGALHEIVPAREAALPAAFGFVVAVLAHVISPPPCGEGLGVGVERKSTSVNVRASPRYPRPQGGRDKVIFVMPGYGSRQCGRLSGHGLTGLGFDPSRAIMVETANRHDSLWALLEALRSGAPQAVVGMIERLDLKTSQKLHLAAADCGLPLLLLRPSQTLESSAAATRWRIGTAVAARDRFGTYARPRWRLQLERCRNGRPGEWVVEYDHVAHRFSLVAALADQTLSHGTVDQSRRQASRS